MQWFNALTQRDIQVTAGGKVSFEFPKFRGLWLSSASHITLYIKLCHSFKIRASTDLPVCVCLSMPLLTV